MIEIPMCKKQGLERSTFLQKNKAKQKYLFCRRQMMADRRDIFLSNK
ncbi:MAG: hypothetical protein ACLUKQ_00240 [Peptococcaceae bacterium]